MNSENVERRSHYRRNFANPIEYVVDGPSWTGPFKGATINTSSRGLCFFTFNPVREDETIRIVKSLLPMQFTEGKVRWVVKVDESFYKVGFMFTEGREQK